MYGVDSKDSVPADFPKKNSGLAPEGLSILAGTGAGHRPLWCPTMVLKIKIPGGAKGAPPWRLFPRSYSISLGQMRKHLRGPGQATYDFDGVRPGLLVVKKGWPAGQTLPSLASLLFAHAIKHMLCFGTSFLCAEKGGKDAGSSAGFLPMKTGGSRISFILPI